MTNLLSTLTVFVFVFSGCSPMNSAGSAAESGLGNAQSPPPQTQEENPPATTPEVPPPPETSTPPSMVQSVISGERTTVWDPGIPGGIPNRTKICATLEAANFGNGSTDAASAIQSALDSNCAEGGVVVLSAGTFKISKTLNITKGVVLRGAGSVNGGHPATVLNRSPAGTVIMMGGVNSTASADAGPTAYNLTADGIKDSYTVKVGANAAKFAKGEIAQIDVNDDPAVVWNPDCPYFKRAGRSVGQRVEIQSVDTAQGLLTLSSPLHWTFKTSLNAQIAKINHAITRNAGVEGLLIRGGNNPYDGAGIDIWNAAYSWVKDVETDGNSITGMHVVLSGAYRVEVRDSAVHHSGNYGYGVGSYGIVIRFQSADNLVENNIARYMNKPILFNASGGGNVVAYNYADDAWATPGWQETAIDCHCTFPHMELIEGNFAPHMGASGTHGNAGYLTYFRNYASTQYATRTGLTGNVAALQFDKMDIGMNAVGNVLGSANVANKFEGSNTNDRLIYSIGQLGQGLSDPAGQTLYRHANYDYFNKGVLYAAGQEKNLPASLYLKAKPAWWPAGTAWPWVGPDISPMVQSLPAKTRSLNNDF
jgi:hypothetical protein